MSVPIGAAEFDSLFHNFTVEAWRLETRDAYAMSYEREDYERFLSGDLLIEPPDMEWFKPWLDMITKQTGAGKRVGRVRLLAEPPTDYQRWEMWVGSWNSRAGEELRYMPRARAVELGLPTNQDWWMFDSESIVILRFNDNNELLGYEKLTDPAIVAQHLAWRDLAVRHSAPAAGFAAT
ncbi:MAG: DUF6879 family protein [Micromonosporaceae bacterium]